MSDPALARRLSKLQSILDVAGFWGIALHEDAAGWFVGRVAAGSDAAEAGIAVGLRLVSVDGTASEKLDLTELDPPAHSQKTVSARSHLYEFDNGQTYDIPAIAASTSSDSDASYCEAENGLCFFCCRPDPGARNSCLPVLSGFDMCYVDVYDQCHMFNTAYPCMTR